MKRMAQRINNSPAFWLATSAALFAAFVILGVR